MPPTGQYDNNKSTLFCDYHDFYWNQKSVLPKSTIPPIITTQQHDNKESASLWCIKVHLEGLRPGPAYLRFKVRSQFWKKSHHMVRLVADLELLIISHEQIEFAQSFWRCRSSHCHFYRNFMVRLFYQGIIGSILSKDTSSCSTIRSKRDR